MTTSMEESVAFDLSLLRCAAGTDVGMRRNENQDSFGIIKREGFHGYFVADGMGGVHGGAVASRTVIASLEELLPRNGELPTIASLCSVVETVNKRIFDKGSSVPNLAGMGTTLVGVVFTSQSAYSINVGDSRLYRVRGSAVEVITEDHTLVRELVKSGALSEEEAEHHPVSHMLTRSLGPLAAIDVDCRPLAGMPEPGDVFVLCSDGLYNLVSEQEILEVVRQNPLDDANQILINLANQRGGTDNITVVIIEVGNAPGRSRGEAFRQARDASSAAAAANRDEPRDGEPTHSEGTEPRKERELPQERAEDGGGGDSSSRVARRDGEERSADSAEQVSERKRQGPKAGETRTRRSLSMGVSTSRMYGWSVRLMVAAALCFGLVTGSFIRRTVFSPDDSFDDSQKGVGLDRGSVGGSGDGRIVPSPGTVAANSVEAKSGRESYVVDAAIETEFERPQRISPAERERMQKLRLWYMADISKTETQLASIDQGDPGDIAELSRDARRRADILQTLLGQIEDKKVAASKYLTLWYGRQRRLENEGALGLASDVGASLESVKEKKAALDRVNYEYIKRRDEFEMNPGDGQLPEIVKRLNEERIRLMRELEVEVRKGIDAVLTSTFKQLEDLNAEREIKNMQLQAAKQDLELAKSLAEPDINRREAIREKLQQKVLGLRASLSDLDGKLERSRGTTDGGNETSGSAAPQGSSSPPASASPGNG